MKEPDRARNIHYLATLFALPGVEVGGNEIRMDARGREAVAMGADLIANLNELLGTKEDANAIRLRPPAARDAIRYMSETYEGPLGGDENYTITYTIGRDRKDVRDEWGKVVKEVKKEMMAQDKETDNITGHGGFGEKISRFWRGKGGTGEGRQ